MPGFLCAMVGASFAPAAPSGPPAKSAGYYYFDIDLQDTSANHNPHSVASIGYTNDFKILCGNTVTDQSNLTQDVLHTWIYDEVNESISLASSIDIHAGSTIRGRRFVTKGTSYDPGVKNSYFGVANETTSNGGEIFSFSITAAGNITFIDSHVQIALNLGTSDWPSDYTFLGELGGQEHYGQFTRAQTNTPGNEGKNVEITKLDSSGNISQVATAAISGSSNSSVISALKPASGLGFITSNGNNAAIQVTHFFNGSFFSSSVAQGVLTQDNTVITTKSGNSSEFIAIDQAGSIIAHTATFSNGSNPTLLAGAITSLGVATSQYRNVVVEGFEAGQFFIFYINSGNLVVKRYTQTGTSINLQNTTTIVSSLGNVANTAFLDVRKIHGSASGEYYFVGQYRNDNASVFPFIVRYVE